MPRARTVAGEVEETPPEFSPSNVPESSTSPTTGRRTKKTAATAKTPTRKAKTPAVKREVHVGDEGMVHTFVAPGVVIASELAKSAGMPSKYAPTSDEVDSIFRPLERYFLRRLKVDATSTSFHQMDPDKKDLILTGSGLLGYGMRVAFDGNNGNERIYREPTTGNSKPRNQEPTTSPTQDVFIPSPGNGNGGPGYGENGNVVVESISQVNADTVAQASMGKLWSETFRPTDDTDD